VGKVHLYRFQKRTGQQKIHNIRGQEEERTSNTIQRLRNSEGERPKEVSLWKKISRDAEKRETKYPWVLRSKRSDPEARRKNPKHL
jgi:hypothetical protein